MGAKVLHADSADFFLPQIRKGAKVFARRLRRLSQTFFLPQGRKGAMVFARRFSQINADLKNNFLLFLCETFVNLCATKFYRKGFLHTDSADFRRFKK